MTAVLGLNAYHGDSSAALIIGGRLVAAAEEERFNRVKHWAGLPVQAVAYCLEEASIELGDVDHVALNRDPRANLARKALYTLTRLPSPRLVKERLDNARAWLSIEEELQERLLGRLRADVTHVEHHLAHLASSFFGSPYDESVLISVDGYGDFASAAWGVGRGGRIEREGRVYFPHSLGLLYTAVTQYLGFPQYGDEYKVMGLAPYGEPMYADRLRQVVRPNREAGFRLDMSYFLAGRESVAYQWRDAPPSVGRVFSDKLVDLLGPPRGSADEIEQRHRDIARSLQVVYEEAFFHMLRGLHARHGVDRIAVSGGCAMNSVANGRISLESPFTHVFVPPAPGDAGGAIGAAAYVAAQLDPSVSFEGMTDPYCGPAFSSVEIERVIERTLGSDMRVAVTRVEDEILLCERTAAAIADGAVLGWFQGRMEWGPRALGNRSILCDPRRSDMKAILNRKIKRRESFRPFAPSILREHVSDWFEQDDDVPYMSKVFQVRASKRDLIPAVTHVDGSGRLQTVSLANNALYHRLIEAFRRRTGVPLLLNTSFNENEPIVCRPEEALDCFVRSEMDVVVLGPFFVSRIDVPVAERVPQEITRA